MYTKSSRKLREMLGQSFDTNNASITNKSNVEDNIANGTQVRSIRHLNVGNVLIHDLTCRHMLVNCIETRMISSRIVGSVRIALCVFELEI